VNVEFINPFLNSMSNVLATMATLDIHQQGLGLKKDNIPQGDVTGVISMHSEKTKGTLAISFSEAVVLQIAQRMLGEVFTVINKDIIDLVGEITNIVCGGAKQLLEQKGFSFDLARPIVIVGKTQQVGHTAKTPVIVIPFTTEAGEFYVEVCFTR
jgi:chemotaxis protein CheX